MTPQEYAERVCNNAASLLVEATRDLHGDVRDLAPEAAAGVLIAQSNLAIAAALLVVADRIGGRS